MTMTENTETVKPPELIEKPYTPYPPYVPAPEIAEKLRVLLQYKKEEKERIERARHEPVTVVKIGRNESCPCGSGKKYKKCCLLKEAS